MKVKLNISPLQTINGFEMKEIDSVFGVLTVRRYEDKGEWLVFAPFWWEHLFNEKFKSSEEAIKFIEMRCEEYINEVLGWCVPTIDTNGVDSLSKVSDKRLMVFTSLLRTLNFVGHSRIDQCYGLFVNFEKEYPLIDGYTRTGKAVDHRNMRYFIENYKGGEINV